MEKVLIVDPVHDLALTELKKKYEVIYELQPEKERFKELIKDADVLVLRSGVKLDKEILEQAEKLKIVARAGIGVDNIDIDKAKEKGVKVFNIPGASSISVAELAFGLILSLTRKIALADSQLRKNEWKKPELYGSELGNKTIGIVGLGKIGREVARIANGFSMRVLACVKNYSEERKEKLKEGKIELVNFDGVLKNSDIVVLSLPKTEETENLITRKELEIMKPSSFLINVARGGIVNEDDLYEALRNNVISGGATDVFIEEKKQNKLFELDNVVVTPHIGAMTHETQKRIAEVIIKNINNGLQGKEIQNQIC